MLLLGFTGPVIQAKKIFFFFWTGEKSAQIAGPVKPRSSIDGCLPRVYRSALEPIIMTVNGGDGSFVYKTSFLFISTNVRILNTSPTPWAASESSWPPRLKRSALCKASWTLPRRHFQWRRLRSKTCSSEIKIGKIISEVCRRIAANMRPRSGRWVKI